MGVKKILNIAITTGDSDGIGLEVALKALLKRKPSPNVVFSLFKKSNTPSHLIGLERAVTQKYSRSRSLIIICQNSNPALWVGSAARDCMSGKFHALVTAPLSKTTIRRSGIRSLGHTEILKSIAGVKNVHMSFLGDKFNVVLVTTHIPLNKVSQNISLNSLCSAVLAADKMRAHMPRSQSQLPIALVGLNPHAGEKGLLGGEELKLFKPALQRLRRKRIRVTDPLVPDAAFFPENWKKYSVFVCPYHDQGLIPFKLVHGHSRGVNMTLGLPFVRTSVDHGTAKDIFKLGVANPGSMMDAIETAIRFAKRKI